MGEGALAAKLINKFCSVWFHLEFMFINQSVLESHVLEICGVQIEAPN